MYHSDTEFIFPMRVASQLRELRGDTWAKLVDQACNSPKASLDRLAFSLLLIRLSSCLTCHTNSYRALRGCTFCATHTIRRFRDTDQDLVFQFHQAREEIVAYLVNGQEGAEKALKAQPIIP